MYASAGGGKAGDCVELVSCEPSVWKEPCLCLSRRACALSYPTHASRGARDDDASVQCNGRGAGVEALQEQRQQQVACLLLASRECRAARLLSLMGKT